MCRPRVAAGLSGLPGVLPSGSGVAAAPFIGGAQSENPDQQLSGERQWSDLANTHRKGYQPPESNDADWKKRARRIVQDLLAP